MKRFTAADRGTAESISPGAMAALIEGNLRPTGMRFLQLRSEGARPGR